MNGLKNVFKRITRDRWEIGFVDGGVVSLFNDEPLKINWLDYEFADRWFADPFVMEVTESEIVVLVEEFTYETKKGRIAELIIDRESFKLKSTTVLLELDTHLSFPAIRRVNGKVFVYPESWLSGKLSVYEYLGRGKALKLAGVLCEESMADAVITDLFGKTQLFSTKENDILRIYNWDEQIEQFTFSKQVVFKTATARNAGDFFEYQGKVYRPAQVCEHCYGEALEIQEVACDQEGGFVFEPIRRFFSNHPELRRGMHTLNSYKGVCVIDVHGYNNPKTVKSIHTIKRLLLGESRNNI